MTSVGNDAVLEDAWEKCARVACAVSAGKRVRAGRNEEVMKTTGSVGRDGFPRGSNGHESSAKPSKREE
jgi:hypothetical protein